LSEKQTPQVVEKVEKPKEQMEGLEASVVLRRQTLFATERRAHPWLPIGSTALAIPVRTPIIPEF
jgi:hypothetical protein